MASIIKKKKKNRWYYYAVESARVNGKPRIVWQKYLGMVGRHCQTGRGGRAAQAEGSGYF